MDDDDDGYLTDGKTDTSRAAGESIRDQLGKLENWVYTTIVQSRNGLTCYEVEQQTGLPHETASARITGLQRKRHLRDTGRRRPSRTGRPAIVWDSPQRIHARMLAGAVP